jgi:hypothetical protein
MTIPYETMSKSDLIGIIEAQKRVVNAQHEKLQWYEGILSNKSLPINQRLATIAAKRLEETRKPDEDGFYRAHLPALAETVGVSPSTISRGLKSLADCTQAVEHRTVSDKNEPYKHIVFIRPTDLLARPAEITPTKEIKRHGGDHRKCQCGGELLVKERVLTSQQYTVCTTCGVQHVYPPRTVNEPLVCFIEEQEPPPLHDATGLNEQESFTTNDMPETQEPPPLHHATGLNEQEHTVTISDADEAPTHCNLQSLPLHTSSHCTLTALEELKMLPQWACHRAKRPYNPNKSFPAAAAVDDPETWGSYEQALAMVERSQAWKEPYDGIGFMLRKGGGLVVTDYDPDRETNTLPNPELVDRRIQFTNSYHETSSSGVGRHGIAKGDIPRNIKSKKHGLEMYSHAKFIVFTGNHLPGTPETIENRQAELSALFAEIAPKPVERPMQNCVSVPCLFSDEHVLTKARNGKNAARFERLWSGDTSGYGSQSEADLALCNELAYWSDYDSDMVDRLFRQSGLYRPEKWDRNARAGETYGEGTIRRAIGAKLTS